MRPPNKTKDNKDDSKTPKRQTTPTKTKANRNNNKKKNA
eukprot:CAMPEP_0167798194 /NCGR_PEP_ID=MMETSP0111_2-20121227/16155_1 /TAXON_ID=91324 /ORGANISM="Lotharella globosa, Strain CCCM811" /LENGTH=38 /DNA_ID= /DNA_START= /DNA_END= /DNA_ORIENTATION=